MSLTVSAADADQYAMEFAGVSLSAGVGWADDEFLTIELVTETFADTVGTDGVWSMGKTNDKRIDIKFRTLQSSALNAILSALWTVDTNQPNGAGISSFGCADLQGTTVILCTRSRIWKPPQIAVARKPGMREWWIRGLADTYIVGGN